MKTEEEKIRRLIDTARVPLLSCGVRTFHNQLSQSCLFDLTALFSVSSARMPQSDIILFMFGHIIYTAEQTLKSRLYLKLIHYSLLKNLYLSD